MSAEATFSSKPYENLLWADTRDFRQPAGFSVRGVRFLTCVEVQLGTVFIVEGATDDPLKDDRKKRTFVAGSFAHALAQCFDWQLADPTLFVYLHSDRSGTGRTLAHITEVHGTSVNGPLVLKLASGETTIFDAESRPMSTGQLTRLFPPT